MSDEATRALLRTDTITHYVGVTTEEILDLLDRYPAMAAAVRAHLAPTVQEISHELDVLGSRETDLIFDNVRDLAARAIRGMMGCSDEETRVSQEG